MTVRGLIALCIAVSVLAPNTLRASVDSSSAAIGLSSIARVADSLGYTWQWERTFNRLTCVRQPDQVRFYENISFCFVNGTPVRLPQPPCRIGATLYLPQGQLERLFTSSRDTTARADTAFPLQSDRTVLGSGKRPGVNIQSVAVEKKKNGTLLSIGLSDSLPYDVTYFYPNLTFNFFGGTIDTVAIRRLERVGIVNSIFSIQFESSAQVTALLNREIEEPMIDFVQDTRTIMVSLKPSAVAPRKSVKPVKQQVVDSTSAGMTIVVLDPGHGGKDPGCIGATGVQEKDVVLPIALRLRETLKRKKGLTIYMTREKDVFVPLIDRTRFANSKKAHLFISIHADAISGDAKRKQNTSGYKIYFLSQAKNEEDKLVAMRENAVIELEDQPQKYSNLQNVLIEMAGNEYLSESQDLCIQLEQKFGTSLQKKITRLHRGIGQANFWVLNGAFMPSVLVETGFLSQKKEEQLLADADFRRKMADAMSEAIIAFCEKFGSGVMNDPRPIGILDSGLGGLTVAREVCRIMPGEHIVYYGDTAHYPYGNRPDGTIRTYAQRGTEILLQHDIKVLIVACNTISSVALDVVERCAPGVPVIGAIMPGARAAVLRTADRKIGVIGSAATIRSGAYKRAIGRLDASAKVYDAVTALLVPLVEENLIDHDLTRLAAQLYLYELIDLGVDCLILGCTHFPPLFEVIQGTVGTRMQVIDSALWVAKEAQDILMALDLCAAADTAGRPGRRFFLSEMPPDCARQAELFFGAPLTDGEIMVAEQVGAV